MRRIHLLVTMGLLGLPPATPAQTAPGWDVAVLAGFTAARPDPPPAARHYERWTRAGSLAVSAGRYWSMHFRTDLELTAGAEARRFAEHAVAVPGVPWAGYGSEIGHRIQTAAVLATWQFFENQWVHPFVSGGLAVDRATVRTRIWAQSFAPEQTPVPEVTVAARGVVAAGAKWYVSPRAFIKTDGRVSFGGRFEHAQFRAGVGVDF